MTGSSGSSSIKNDEVELFTFIKAIFCAISFMAFLVASDRFPIPSKVFMAFFHQSVSVLTAMVKLASICFFLVFDDV